MTVLGFKAVYFDGVSSRAHDVTLQSDDQALIIEGAKLTRRYGRAEVEIAPRLGSLPRILIFADGSRCETPDSAAVDRLARQWGSKRPGARIHRLENSLGLIALMTLAALAIGWLAFSTGIPWLATQVAFALPEEVDHHLGQGALEALDGVALDPSRLPAARQRDLKRQFEELADAAGLGNRVELELRRGGSIGANALALPSGIIVVTDELVRLAEDDREIVAVLAHELGHIDMRHTLRLMLQSSASVLIIATMTGDLASVSSLSGTLPVLVLNLSYSRRFETEADDFAVALLQVEDMSTHHLVTMLERLAASQGSGSNLRYLSTHPDTSERIQRIREAPLDAGSDALDVKDQGKSDQDQENKQDQGPAQQLEPAR